MAKNSGATGGSFGPPVSSNLFKDTGGEDATSGTQPEIFVVTMHEVGVGRKI